MPLSCEVVEKGGFGPPICRGGDISDFGHAFSIISNRTHFRAGDRFWLSSVQRTRRVFDGKGSCRRTLVLPRFYLLCRAAKQNVLYELWQRSTVLRTTVHCAMCGNLIYEDEESAGSQPAGCGRPGDAVLHEL